MGCSYETVVSTQAINHHCNSTIDWTCRHRIFGSFCECIKNQPCVLPLYLFCFEWIPGRVLKSWSDDSFAATFLPTFANFCDCSRRSRCAAGRGKRRCMNAETMNFVVQMMNFVVKMMNFVVQMMNFVVQMMDEMRPFPPSLHWKAKPLCVETPLIFCERWMLNLTCATTGSAGTMTMEQGWRRWGRPLLVCHCVANPSTTRCIQGDYHLTDCFCDCSPRQGR